MIQITSELIFMHTSGATTMFLERRTGVISTDSPSMICSPPTYPNWQSGSTPEGPIIDQAKAQELSEEIAKTK